MGASASEAQSRAVLVNRFRTLLALDGRKESEDSRGHMSHALPELMLVTPLTCQYAVVHEDPWSTDTFRPRGAARQAQQCDEARLSSMR